jgi:hypothetical protein
VNTFGHMCGTIDPGSCIRWVLGFGIKTGYDSSLTTSSLYFSYKEKQIVNVTTPIIMKMQQKYVKNSTVEILPLECTTYRGLKGHFPCDPSSTFSYQAAVGHFHTPVGMS